MGHISKRRIAVAFAVGAIACAIAVVGIFATKIYKADKAEAQSAAGCLPILGKTTETKVKVGLTPDTDPAGIANAGLIDFNNYTDTRDIIIGNKTVKSGIFLSEANHACAEKQTDANGNFTGYKLKGIEWNNNLGPISFACEDGFNRIHTCYKDEPAHQVVIAKNGAFSGQAWGSQIGLINFLGTAGGSNIPVGLRLDLKKIGADSYAPIGGGGGQWAWSDRVGWIDMTGVSFPWTGATEQHDIDIDGYCAIGDTAAVCFTPPKKGSGDCNDNITAINPGAADDCANKIDMNCDGVLNCGGGCVDTDGDEYCDNSGGGGGGGGGDCNDDPTLNGAKFHPGAAESLCSAEDYNCDGSYATTQNCTTLSGDYACDALVPLGNVKSVESLENKFSENKKIILRNVAKARTSTDISYNQPILTLEDVSIFYYENMSVYIDNDLPAGKNKTVVAVGGDIYIKSDIKNGQLGVVALKNEFGNGGNVYIGHTVKNLKAQIFADSGVYSYNQNSGSTSLDISNGDLWRQLVIEGTITSQNNSFDTPAAGEYTTASFACLRTVKKVLPPGTGLIDIPVANKAIGASSTKKAVFLNYSPPSPDLPVFGGFSGMGVSQGG